MKSPNGLRIITPEWLVILKYNAGRQKDLDDIVFLLKQGKLVDRPKVKQNVVATAGGRCVADDDGGGFATSAMWCTAA